MKTIVITLFMVLLFSGCVKSVLSPRDYISWVEDESNGLKITKEIAGQTFELQYKPVGYEVLMQTNDENISESDYNAIRNEIDELQYFTLTIISSDHKELAMSGMADEDEYTERITYMMSEMQYDFELVDGKDTLPCAFFHAERNFNLSPENHILLGFEKIKTDNKELNDKTLIYTDRILDCGPVMITIKADDLENIPELKFAE